MNNLQQLKEGSRKEIRVIQNSVERYNWLGNEETLRFSIGLYEDGKVVEENGVRAILYYSGEVDEKYDFDNYIEDMDIGDIFNKCYQYANSVWSSTDYKAQCLLFAKIYQECHREILKNWIEQKDEKAKEEIERLRKDIGNYPRYFDKEYFTDAFANTIGEEIAKYERLANLQKQKLNEYKEGTKSFEKANKKIQEYQEKIENLKNLI